MSNICDWLREAWRYFTGSKTKAQFLRFAVVGFLGCAWMFAIMWFIIDFLRLDIGFWFLIWVDTWKVAYAMSALFGLVHNFLLNKLLGGLTKIETKRGDAR